MIVLGKQKCAKCSLALIFRLPVGEALHNNQKACFSLILKLKSSGVFEAFVPIRHLWERHASTEVPLMLSHRAPSILLGPHEEISEYIVRDRVAQLFLIKPGAFQLRDQVAVATFQAGHPYTIESSVRIQPMVDSG